MNFSYQCYLMAFHLILGDSTFLQFSRTLLNILTVVNNAVIWMVATPPQTSKSSSHFNNPLVTVPKAPITIGIIVTCMFQSFFYSLQSQGTYPSFHVLSDLFSGPAGQKHNNFASSLFLLLLLINIRPGLLVKIM